ncbi:MAG: class I SAM-dependent methyltransferase [Oscillospiraceae bacterium]|nr:class I SAM-dependent methyltransferase [Oscillospiraceae bacterium]
MWISDGWKDYELLDCSGGEKLERWGEYILRRPDPQVIWDTGFDRAWDKADAVYRRSASGGGRWTRSDVPESWTIGYDSLKFNVKLMNFKHTGIFPEQASNWDFIRRRVKNAGRVLKILNLFAYTGAATVAAAEAGAEVCHVDAAKGMVAWARENAALSSLADRPVRWIVDDCRKFVEKEIRRGRRYDAIIMDPPSYGRGPSGEVWKLEDSLFDFLKLCAGVLSERPDFVLISSYTTGLSPSVLTYLGNTVFSEKYPGSCESGELGLRVSKSGLVLPCGSACRWTCDNL